jgi:hypothetical protein
MSYLIAEAKEVKCDLCGKEFEAISPRKRYCSPECKRTAARSRRKGYEIVSRLKCQKNRNYFQRVPKNERLDRGTLKGWAKYMNENPEYFKFVSRKEHSKINVLKEYMYIKSILTKKNYIMEGENAG